MPQSFDENFQALIHNVSHQIEYTDASDARIAEICGTSIEFVRRQRKFLSLGPYTHFKEDTMPAKKIQISKDDLYQEYVENEKTAAQCAEVFNCSTGTILKRLKAYSVPVRHRGTNTYKTDTPLATDAPAPPKDDAQQRLLERLFLLSAVKEASIQELLEEALELLFEKYDKGGHGHDG